MDWYKFFTITIRHFEAVPDIVPGLSSWCAWTTFDRLERDSEYWSAPLPKEDELIKEFGMRDGGMWGQPFPFSSLAHVIIPRKFSWEALIDKSLEFGVHEQDIEGLSVKLEAADIPHNLSTYALDVKLY